MWIQLQSDSNLIITDYYKWTNVNNFTSMELRKALEKVNSSIMKHVAIFDLSGVSWLKSLKFLIELNHILR